MFTSLTQSMRDPNSFAKWFANQLERSDKTQLEIAKECGLSRSYLTTLKTKGTGRLPSVGTLLLLVRALGADIDAAFEAAGIEMPENLRRTVGPRFSQRPTIDKMEIEIAALKNHAT